ncbi:MAG: NADH:ubiquinone reductase (Na(+)-transporting) subunit C [Candidatus Cryptobacteroides sp.]
MNTNSNTYTVIYSIVLVVVVAAVLAFAAISLKPAQDENVKIETITQVLKAAVQADATYVLEDDVNVTSLYSNIAVDAFYVNGNGEKVKSMNTGKEDVKDITVASTSDLKKQNDIIKQIEAGKTELLASLELPVYVIGVKGTPVTVIPCYGAGLWGPIWGYIAVAENGRNIYGAIFDHKSETPGLGAKITEEPFYSQFSGKEFASGDVLFSVVKGGAKGSVNGVDAISGATITSQSLGRTINTWVKYYEPYFSASSAGCHSLEDACCGGCESESAVESGCCGGCEATENVEE